MPLMLRFDIDRVTAPTADGQQEPTADGQQVLRAVLHKKCSRQLLRGTETWSTRFLDVNDELGLIRYFRSRHDFEVGSKPSHEMPLSYLMHACTVPDKHVQAFEVRFAKEEDGTTGSRSEAPDIRFTSRGKRSSTSRNIASGSGVVWCFGTETSSDRDRWVHSLLQRIDRMRPPSASETEVPATPRSPDMPLRRASRNQVSPAA
uniref:PH domain-containing protein n=1 Tax=Prymnesium polylepis TaxID=72548 RepID=A0A6T8A5L6_9EUKA|mmetsp:Transcript_10582/g.28170  ORF Transcript_10582/g.28170 Transcript_10582/m.28170 type:complete len:204 (-) Transcript_10582:198-809(-)